MSSQPNEVMRFELDITDVQAKAARIQDLLGKIASGQATGQGTDQFESQLTKEMEGLSKSTGKTREAQTALDGLLRNKEKLSSVVAILGGQFGGMIGQLGNVAELFTSVGSATSLATMAAAGGAAGVAALATWWRMAADAARAYNDEVDRKAARESSASQKGEQEIAEMAQLREAAGLFGGARTPTERAVGLRREQGIPKDTAAFGVLAQELAGLSADDREAVMAGFLVTGRTAKLGSNRDESLQQINRLVRVGRENIPAFRARVADTRSATIREALGISFDPDQETPLQADAERLRMSPEVVAQARRARVPSDGKLDIRRASSAFFESINPPTEEEFQFIDDQVGAVGARAGAPSSGGPAAVYHIDQRQYIQTQINGAGSVYGDPTSSVAQRSPGSTNGARAIVP
ncbi:MAG: hypothetical protein IT450_16805 [Phycisphaerales bacterium]|nr:hypothetical protein [Phycisphaerales bacterium]